MRHHKEKKPNNENCFPYRSIFPCRRCFHAKKNPEPTQLSIRDIPFLSTELIFYPHPTVHVVMRFIPFVPAGLLTFGSSYWLRLPDNSNSFRSLPVTWCSGRPRLQRRARPRLSRGSLLSSYWSAFTFWRKTLKNKRINVKSLGISSPFNNLPTNILYRQ